ncbi:coiled-coil domain-containing protein 9 isoform X2 [Varanus komodoensis]|uniref:coiled-coil domain-containing protein 9 isoform X2 n=1 Tax=Varanus komodoensis TaxID=61221 RepID=UPI001CF7CB7F|nr:coiled-coil domain-containing protein 9 isoform X2 [Varanus komodoensis]
MSASLDLKSKEEKDAELDKRIEALRLKNQALIRRYQEIEEDRKKAEQEGIAVTGARRPRSTEGEAPERRRGVPDAPTLTVQVVLSPQEKRVVSSERKPPAPRKNPHSASSPRAGTYLGHCAPRAEGPPEQPGWDGAGRDGPGAGKRGSGGRSQRPQGRGGPAGDAGPDRRSKEREERRRQNIEKMNEEMQQIAAYERSQRDGLQEKNPVRNFLDDPRRSGPFAESDRREGSRRHIRNWGGPDFDKVKTSIERGKEWFPPGRGSGRRRGAAGAAALDMTLSMTGRERAEYIRWKQEREQIDQERLARHRQPTGEWRREWDAEKAEAEFKEGDPAGASPACRRDESKRTPRRPTFGEFLPEQQRGRRRGGRGCGRPRGGASKPYSMHDNRWEREEPAPATAPSGKKTDLATKQQVEPVLPHTGPAEDEEEEEDQWEDVSGGEEEEEEEEAAVAGGSDRSEGSSTRSRTGSEEQDPGRNGHLSSAMPPSQGEAPSPEGNPVAPSSPAEGYPRVSDWGEEMELSSPRAEAAQSRFPLIAQEEPSTRAGRSLPDSLANQGSPLAASADGEVPPAPSAPAPEAGQELAAAQATEKDLQELGTAVEPVSGPVPSPEEIADVQREHLEA